MAEPSNSGAVLRAQERRAAKVAFGRHRQSKSFYMMLHVVWRTPQRFKLSGRATKLLVDLSCQFNGHNNGDLTTAWVIMRGYGWRSKDQLKKAQDELESRGWIQKTRQGMRSRGAHSPTLWALTFEGIDDCGSHKRDAGIKPDRMPLNLWRLPEFDTPALPIKRTIRKQQKQKPCPPHGAGFPVVRGESAAKAWPFVPLFPVVRGENRPESVIAFPVARAPYKKYAKGPAAEIVEAA